MILDNIEHPTEKRPGYLSSGGESSLTYSAPQILQAISDGVYVTDRQRRIVYWNQAAERITGWRAEEVLGKSCYDNILCHVDKDGHRLCGEEYCPLHRAMRTGRASEAPSLVFAQDKSGRRVPVMVNVSPIVDGQGKVIGGVEVFRDYSAQIHDQERARKIQSLSMQLPTGETPGLNLAVKYLPHGVLGGDYYTMERLDEHRYAFCIADVMGHGTAAGLYAMHLHSLWENNRRFIDRPATFVSSLNRNLCSLVRDGESFATGLFGIIDLRAEALALCAAGSPSFILHRGGQGRQIRLSSLPLGLVEDHVYEVTFLPLEPGDGLLFYTDGLIEASNQQEEMLGSEGLLAMLNQLDFPTDEEDMDQLVKKVLRFSNQIRFADDVTLLAMQYTGRYGNPAFPSPEEQAKLAGEVTLLPNNFRDIDEVVESCWNRIKEVISQQGFGPLEVNIHMALAEAIINAWKHGNRGNQHQPIIFRWCFNHNFTFEVLDQGAGFNYHNLPDPTEGERKVAECGRGIFIIKTLANAVQWRDQGRHLTVTFSLQPKS